MTDQHRATPEQWEYQERWASDDDDASCILELRCRVETLEADQLEQAESNRFCVDAIVRRVEALEAAQQDKLDRLIAMDADPDPDDVIVDEGEQFHAVTARTNGWRPLETEITYCTEAAIATAQQLAHRIQSGTLTPAEQAELGVVPVVDLEAAVHRAAAEARDAVMTELRAASDEPISMATAQQILRAPIVVEGTFEHGGETYRFKAKPEPADAMAELRAASAEAQGLAILSWSEERQPCEECRYNHYIAETPFGRFLISWKGWKDHFAVTADETPFGDWFECWNSVEEAKSGCQSEYNRRLALVPLSQPQPELRAASDEPISMATAQQILRAPITVEGTFEHGGETYRFKAKPEPADAMPELRAASAEVRSAAREIFPVEYADANGEGIRIIMEPADETGRVCWVVRNSRRVNPIREFPTPEAAYAAHQACAEQEADR
jgi:hypothetical protein